ncbi:MAG: hypothetical protein PF961_08895 [Planctomycetota bacterium]|jgi:hypothetical protein|nr:hypothetical protein [Planctomycetota bacterium]
MRYAPLILMAILMSPLNAMENPVLWGIDLNKRETIDAPGLTANIATEDLFANYSEACMFYYTQQITLSAALTNHPDLRQRILLAHGRFTEAWGSPVQTCFARTGTFLDGFKMRIADLIDHVAGNEALQMVIQQAKTMDRPSTITFLADMQARADGQFPLPEVKRTLCQMMLKDRPSDLLREPYGTRISTKDNPKSLGHDIRLTYPGNWADKSGAAAHTVRKFTHTIGNNPLGTVMIVVAVLEPDPGLKGASTEGLIKLTHDKELLTAWKAELIPGPRAKNVVTISEPIATTLAGLPAITAEVSYEIPIELNKVAAEKMGARNLTVHSRSESYSAFMNSGIITVTFQVSASDATRTSDIWRQYADTFAFIRTGMAIYPPE